MEETEERDMCPVCKTDRYLSPSMVFLINPECYHKICESCVDRIFSLGPTQCPYPNCSKILKKNRFKSQIFEDLSIEKECDVRNRVLKVYNKVEDDFDSLDKYNRYLEEVEEIVYNIVNETNLEATEEKLKEYEALNKEQIKINQLKQSNNYSNFLKSQDIDKQIAKEKKLYDRQSMEDDAGIRSLEQMEKLNEMQGFQDHQLAQAKENSLKKTNSRRKHFEGVMKALSLQKQQLSASEVEQLAEKPKTPFTPFQGDKEESFEMYDYYEPVVHKLIERDNTFKPSGFKLADLYQRALSDSLFGLDCFIAEERA